MTRLKFRTAQSSSNGWSTTLISLMARTKTSQENLAREIKCSKTYVNSLVHGKLILDWKPFIKVVEYFTKQPGGLTTWQAVQAWVETWHEAQDMPYDLTDIFIFSELFPDVPERLLTWADEQIKNGAALLDLVTLLRYGTSSDLKISSKAFQFILEIINGCPDSQSTTPESRLERLLEELRAVILDIHRKVTRIPDAPFTFERILALPQRDIIFGTLAVITSLASSLAKTYGSVDNSTIMIWLLAPIVVYYLPNIHSHLQSCPTRV